MGRKYSLAITTAALVSTSLFTPAHAADDDKTVVLQPLSPWTIDFGEDQCRLVRTFGSEDNLHLLMIQTAMPGSAPGITFAGPAIKRMRVRDETRITLNASEGPRDNLTAYPGSFDTIGKAAIFSSVAMRVPDSGDEADSEDTPDEPASVGEIDLNYAKMIDRLTVSRKDRSVVFETGNMMPPLQALNVCSADLIRAWGLDPEKHKSYKKQPVWTNQERTAQRIMSDYPSSALRAGESALLAIRVTVEVDGAVSGCQLTNLTVADRLKSPACEIIERYAEFEPAIDADGQPMRSFYTLRLTYQVGS